MPYLTSGFSLLQDGAHINNISVSPYPFMKALVIAATPVYFFVDKELKQPDLATLILFPTSQTSSSVESV